MTRRRVILDTDIGSDVDDLMALTVLLGSPDVDVIGVTTVYGDTRLRAQLTRRILSIVDRDVPVHAGERETISGRPVWWAGHEGALHDDLGRERYASDDAVRFLVDRVCGEPGTIDVIAIGPLTNIAKAIEESPGFAQGVRHLWIMGGWFEGETAEHNFRSDAAAARIVFEAGIPATVTGLDVTERIRIAQADLDRMRASGEIGRLVHDECMQWRGHKREDFNVPHDPVCVLTLTTPELFRFSAPGAVSIGTGDAEGVSQFAPGDATTQITIDVDPGRVLEQIVARTETAGGALALSES